MLDSDLSLLVGLAVALAVFLVVTLTSIRILRKKGRSPSMYTMTNLSELEIQRTVDYKSSKILTVPS